MSVDPVQLREQLGNLFVLPELLPERFLSFLVDYLSVNQPMIPVSQVFGFSQFLANATAMVGSSDQTTISTSFTDLTTAGPTLSGLSDGKYLVFHKCICRNDTAGQRATQGVAVNGTDPASLSATETISNKNTNDVSIMGFFLATLSAGGNNSLKARYAVQGGTGAFAERQVAALRYANL